MFQETQITPAHVKYINNIFRDTAAFGRGEFKPFSGHSAERPNGITLRTYYDKDTCDLLQKKLVTPIAEIAALNGINLYPAGLLWTIHTSVAQLLYVPGVTPRVRHEAFEKIMADPRIKEATQALQGVEINFDFLLGGNAISLAASDIPTQVLEARRIFAELGRELKMTEGDYNNIYHATLNRGAGVNLQVLESGGLNSFGLFLLRLHRDVFREPISTTIDKAEVMIDTEMTELHEAPLMAAVAKRLS